jgi:hypothetical protein
MIEIFSSQVVSQVDQSHLKLLELHYGCNLMCRLDNSPSLSYRNRRITSRLMLINICKYLGLPLKNIAFATHNVNGKFIVPDVNISITYSDNVAFCLVSDCSIGLDAENITKDIDESQIRLLERLLNIKISSNIEFFKLWTKAESIVKIYPDRCLSDVFNGDLSIDQYAFSHLLYDDRFLLTMSSLKPLKSIDNIKYLNFN